MNWASEDLLFRPPHRLVAMPTARYPSTSWTCPVKSCSRRTDPLPVS
jgi:hypothetical protein